MYLRRFFLLLFLSCASPFAAALSLGAGQLQSHIGEPFSADIAIIGSYDQRVRFSQVKTAECRASLIGKAVNGCDSIFEGKLELLVGQRADGRYYLHVTSDRSDEMFYRIIIKSESETIGTAFNAFMFLPEFRLSSEVSQVVSSEVAVPEIVAHVPPQRIEVVNTTVSAPSKAALPKVLKRKPETKREPDAVPAAVAVAKTTESQLQIKKHGDYADDIYALQKENVEIEQQIVLLEKHIGLLKEVIRLKAQAGESAVSAVAPAALAVQSAQVAEVTEDAGLLTWLLLAAVLILSALLWRMYRKLERLNLQDNPVVLRAAVPPSLVQDERASLDLTGAYVRPKW